MQRFQRTLREAVTLTGTGLHTGAPASITFRPAPAGHGRVFQRSDLPGSPVIPAEVEYVSDTLRGTSLRHEGASIHTVEHALAALAGMGIDNALIEVNGPEVPIMDGSAIEFVRAIQEAGIEELDETVSVFVLDEAIHYSEPDRKVELIALPSDGFQVSALVDFDSPLFPMQQAALFSLDDFPGQIAACRTFCFAHEIDHLLQADLIKGGSLQNALVFADRPVPQESIARLAQQFGLEHFKLDNGLINPEGFRFENEPARHKLLDIIGDLALVGVPVEGKIIAHRPGHKANIELARRLKARLKQKRIAERFQKTQKKGLVFDINAVQDILPHRYPFLLVDKILEFNENTIVGIKNVTINEPFFAGHFPGNPVMPGVLQLEAMAQVGGVLLLNTIENPKSIWVYFVAIDNARFKKPVIPGDVLVLELEMTALKRGICKMTGKATVDGQLVCSADLVASVIPKNRS